MLRAPISVNTFTPKFEVILEKQRVRPRDLVSFWHSFKICLNVAGHPFLNFHKNLPLFIMLKKTGKKMFSEFTKSMIIVELGY